jgi:hypothetical protein
VLVALTPEGNPFGAEVLAMGLRLEKGRWRVAPLPGNFDNTNVGFDPEVRREVEELELWLAEQRVLQASDLYLRAVADLEKRMKAVELGGVLEDGSATEVVEAFLAACRRKDAAAVLVFLGVESGHTSEMHSPQSIVLRGLRGDSQLADWRLLTSPDVAAIVAEEREQRSATVVSVLFHDADNPSRPKLLNFSVNEDSGRWQVDLPRVLRETFTERRPWQEPSNREKELRDKFHEFFEASQPAERFDDPRAMGERIEEVLREGSLTEFFALLARGDTFVAGERRATYGEAARLWKEFRERGPEATHGQLVDVLVEGTAAAAVFHLVTTADLDRWELVPFVLVRQADGWAIAPGVNNIGNWERIPRQESLDQRMVGQEFTGQKVALERRAAKAMMSGFTLVDPGFRELVSREEAGRVVHEFRDHLRSGDLPAAFACCALLDDAEGALEACRALTYEFRGTRFAQLPDRQLLVQEGGHWAGVSLQLDSGPTSSPDFQLYLVRSTGDGPRVVVDAGLRLALNKGRKLVNDRNWAALEKHLEKEELGLVRSLFEAHLEVSKTEHAEWQKNPKSSR